MLHDDLVKKIAELGDGTSISVVNEALDTLFSENSHPFSGLETQHKQASFYRAHFNLIVSYDV